MASDPQSALSALPPQQSQLQIGVQRKAFEQAMASVHAAHAAQIQHGLTYSANNQHSQMQHGLGAQTCRIPTLVNSLRDRLPEAMRAKVVGVSKHPKAYVVEYASGDITVIPADTWDDDTTVARICLECP